MLLQSKFALFVLFFLGRFDTSLQIDWISLISNAAGANDVVTFAITAVDFISGKSSSDDKLLKSIEESISNTKTEILEGILLQSRFDKIDDAVIGIHSSLVDLEAYFNAADNESGSLKDQFLKRFDDNSVIAHIRFLPELLTYSIPGMTGETLMSLFSKKAACDERKIKAFHAFYLRLISDGVALQIIHEQLSNIDSSKSVDLWATKMVTIREIFDLAEDECWCNGTTTVDTTVDDDSVQITKVGLAFVVLGSMASVVAMIACVYCYRTKKEKCCGKECCCSKCQCCE